MKNVCGDQSTIEFKWAQVNETKSVHSAFGESKLQVDNKLAFSIYMLIFLDSPLDTQIIPQGYLS